MPRFLGVYTMKPSDLARFRAMPKAEQDAVDAAGVKQWIAWESDNAASFLDRGMVGKTLRVSNEGHPHFTIFPGDGVDIMPFVTEPRD